MDKIRVFRGANIGLSHPTAGPIRARGSMWPNDNFTNRRIADGDVFIEQVGSDVAKGGAPAGGVGRDVGETRQAIVDNAMKQPPKK